MKKRLFGILLTLVLVLGMLPGTVLAADPVAQIDETLYNTFAEALAAANEAGGKADPENNTPIRITLLKDTALDEAQTKSLAFTKGLYKLDLGAYQLDLGKVGLEIAADADLIITGGTITTKSEEYALLNRGQLLLESVTILAEQAKYGLLTTGVASAEGVVTTTAIQSGSVSGKLYGVGLEGGKVVLAAAPVVSITAEGEDENKPVNNDPKIVGETAAFSINGGVIQLTAPLHEDTKYAVEALKPGVIVEAEESVPLTNEAFALINDTYTVAQVENRLVLERDITQQISIAGNSFTYNGKIQVPTVTAADETLKQDEAYTVTYTQGDAVVQAPVNAGDYVLTVAGINGYKVEKTAAFAIKKAAPTISWSAEAEELVYAGKAASPVAKATVTLLEGETFNGEISYSHRKNGGAYADGLPTDVGTYDVKAAVVENGNYAGAETAKPLKLTISQLAVENPTITLTAPQNGYVYTGKAVEPKVTVKEGEAEISPSFYTVSYANNINVGTATVTIAPANKNISFTGELSKTFDIGKAEQAALTVSGAPEAVTYGDSAFQLTAGGGSTGETVTWSIAEGSDIASVSADGTVTVQGAGTFTVQAIMAGNDNFNGVTGKLTVTVKPKTLTVTGAAAADKTYDGKKTVSVTEVQLDGIINQDAVAVDVSQLQGEVSAAAAGSYQQITLPELKLSGDDAANYTLIQPTQAVPAAVKINKAALPQQLAEITKEVVLGTEEVTVEELGKGMPADAGKLTYSNGNQSIGDGDGVVVMKRDVSPEGALTVGFVNGKPGDKIICEVVIGSENYADAKVIVNVVMESKKVESDDCTVTFEKDSYVYDGKEHKPKVTVKVDNTTLTEGKAFEVSYPTDTTGVGDKSVTVTFKGDYSGTVTAKYTVGKATLTVSGTKADNKSFDGNTNATVTAGTLKGVVSGDEVTVSAKGTFDNKNSGYSKTVNVTYTLGGKDAGKYVLESNTATVKANITAQTTYYYSNLLSGMSESNVDSADKSTLQAVVNDINNVLTDGSLSSSNRSTFVNLQTKAQNLIEHIDSAAAAVATGSVRSAKDITPQSVKLTDLSTLTKAQSELNSALSTYSGNYTAGEQTAAQAQLQQINDALAVLQRVQAVEKQIDELTDNADAETVAAARAAYDALNDYERSLVTTMALNKLELAEGNPLTTPMITPGAEQNVTTQEEAPETVNFPFGAIILVAVVACGGVAAWYIVKKKKESEANW